MRVCLAMAAAFELRSFSSFQPRFNFPTVTDYSLTDRLAHLPCLPVMHRAVHQASKGFVNIMRQLFKAGAKVNAKDKTGSTPLHRAASAGKYEAAQVLLEEGHAKVDSHDKTGSTALLVAVACREANIAILLASKGADLEVSTK